MRTLLKILLLPLTLIVLFTQCEKNDPVDSVDIPDQAFLTALIELGVDTDGDGIISSSEAEAVIKLDIRGLYMQGEEYFQRNIASLEGIEAFVNIEDLNCSFNRLNTLDVSKNIHLKKLDCGANPLRNLDVSENPVLTFLYCYDNQLTNLDVSTNLARVYELRCNC